MSIEQRPFGRTSGGQTVEQFTLRPRGAGIMARIITYGGHVTELHAPDRNGQLGDVVLGFDRLEGYLTDKAYIGSLVGRFANRIAGGRFTLDGAEYRLPINNGPNTLHGGTTGFNHVVWKAEPRDADHPALQLRYLSPNGQDGFPGTLDVTVVYTVSPESLRIDYTATTDKATPINLTNHSYFNLRGAGSGDVLGHVLLLNASHYTPVDQTLIPDGTIAKVKGTPLDFTSPTPLGKRIGEVPGGGYDHNYALDTGGDLSKLAGRVQEPSTGRVMEFFTTQPGVQLYTGNFLDGSASGIGGPYNKHGAFCLETQHYPDSVHRPNFPDTILRPGQTFHQTTIYRFTTDRK